MGHSLIVDAVIVDDTRLFRLGDPDSSFECRQSTDAKNAFNSTITSCRRVRALSLSSLISLQFSGSAVALIGRPTRALAFEFTIDNSTSLSPVQLAVLEYDENDIGKDGVVLWKLQGLEDPQGKPQGLTIDVVSGELDLDYITYQPFSVYSRPRLPDEILVDDQDDNRHLRYTGAWRNATSVSLPPGFPVSGTYSTTGTTGASFKMNFTGRRVTVFGLLNSVEGRLLASYSVDGRQPVNVTHFDGSQTVNASEWVLSQALYDEALAVGDHQLTVTVVEVTGNQRFYFDYLTFSGPSYYERGYAEPESYVPPKPTNGLRGGLLGGVIAGSIIGGMVLVVAVVLFAKQCRRKIRSAFAFPPPAWSPPSNTGRGNDFLLQPPPVYSPPIAMEPTPPPPPPPSQVA